MADQAEFTSTQVTTSAAMSSAEALIEAPRSSFNHLGTVEGSRPRHSCVSLRRGMRIR